MTILLNSFEGGTSGTAISTANSGGASGSPFNVVTIGTSSALTYSNAQAAHGALSSLFVAGTPSTTAVVGWTTSLTGTTIPQVWFRAYFYVPAFTGSIRAIRVENGSTLCGSVAFNSSGNVVVLDTAGTGRGTSTTVLPAGQWFRIEGYVIGNASTGQVQAQIYLNKDSATPTETVTSLATINTFGAINRVDFGNPSSLANFTYYADDVGASTTGYIGPVKSASASGASIVPQLIAAGVLP